MDKVNVGVIGLGRMGSIHARNLNDKVEDANLIGIADVYEETVNKLGEELEVPLFTTNYQELIKNDDIDAILICSSTDTHAQIICETAETGKDIFCEKPIDLEMEKINQALDAVESANVKLQVGFNRRFDPSFKRAKELIAEGKIGTPHIVRITSRDPKPAPIDYIKRSGGIFLDMTIHDFDMARYLLGEEITEIMAAGECLVDPAIGEVGDVDTAIVTLKYENGALGTIDNSRKAVYGYDQRIEVLGSEGRLIVGNKKKQKAVITSTAQSINIDESYAGQFGRYDDAYLNEMKSFINCVKEDKEPLATGIDGKVVMEICYTANESLKRGSFVKVEEMKN